MATSIGGSTTVGMNLPENGTISMILRASGVMSNGDSGNSIELLKTNFCYI